MLDREHLVFIPKFLGNRSFLEMCLFVEVRSNINGSHSFKPFVMQEYHLFAISQLYFRGCSKKSHIILITGNGHIVPQSILICPMEPTPSLVQGSAEMREIMNA
jgi:hypothetical protein